MKKEFTLNKKDVKDEIVKDRFKSNWWVIMLAILYVLAAIGGLAYSIYESLNIFIYISIACLVIGIAFMVIWSLFIIKSSNSLLGILFGDNVSKSLEVEILEDTLLVSDSGSGEQAPIEYRYLTITKIKHTNNYSMIFFGKTDWLIIPNNVLYPEEVDYVESKANPNKQ